MNLSPSILDALRAKGYVSPTEVQVRSIPLIFAGKDIFGTAQTGTGKTASFALPLLQMMHERKSDRHIPRTLVLAPTRELAIQIADSFRAYGRHTGLRAAIVYGGVSQHRQVSDIVRGVDIIVATPGRLLDLMNQGHVRLSGIEYLVLDEADRMLDMGFIHDIRKIVDTTPSKRQTLMFSATLAPEVRQLASSLLRNPELVDVKPAEHDQVQIAESVYLIDKVNKSHLLCDLVQEKTIQQALVFTRTKFGADKLARHLTQAGIAARAIHGNKSQNERQRTLAGFKSGNFSLLIATDVASRGIDVKELSHVINFDIPEQPNSYVHRIGRTGRAGATGIAISFCSYEERPFLRDIHKFTGKAIPVEEHKYGKHLPLEPAMKAQPNRNSWNADRTRRKPRPGRSRSFRRY